MNRKYVILLMFDLPVVDKQQKVNYSRFRKYIIRDGYMQLQKSVYIKLLHNSSNVKSEVMLLEKTAPEDGDVKILPMPLSMFKKIITIRGTIFDMYLFSDDIVIL